MSLQALFDKYQVQTDDQTMLYVFNHSMIRVKDLAKSIQFYSEVLGFVPVYEQSFSEAAFTIVYLVRRNIADIPLDDEARKQWVLAQAGVLELTYNHGSEQDPDCHYHDGNTEPRGFGHFCVSVPDVRAACERFNQMGVPFQKQLHEGRMQHIAFIKDPDGYWIEILQPTPLAD